VPETWDLTKNELPPGAEPLETTSAGVQRASHFRPWNSMPTRLLARDEAGDGCSLKEPELGPPPLCASAGWPERCRDCAISPGSTALIGLTLRRSSTPPAHLASDRASQDRGGPGRSEVLATPDLQTVAEALGQLPRCVVGAMLVVVEGQTEKRLLPIWARKLGIDLESKHPTGAAESLVQRGDDCRLIDL